MKTVPDFDPSKFNSSYYGSRGNNGLGPEYHWDSPAQQEQLKYKYGYLEKFAIRNILFVGCAQGNEVRYFQERGIDSFGVDVSEWATTHRLPGLEDRVFLFNGTSLERFGDRQFDAVACFDVFTFLPNKMLVDLAKEIQRVTRSLIVFRATFKTWKNKGNPVDGMDGVVFKAPEFYDLDEAFQGEFLMNRVEIDCNYSGVFWYTRQ